MRQLILVVFILVVGFFAYEVTKPIESAEREMHCAKIANRLQQGLPISYEEHEYKRINCDTYSQ